MVGLVCVLGGVGIYCQLFYSNELVKTKYLIFNNYFFEEVIVEIFIYDYFGGFLVGRI
jgi:hypothetical protein